MNLLVPMILELLWILWTRTIRLEVRGLEAVDEDVRSARTPVFAVPHHTILLSALAYRNRPATLLASLSSDGELAARFLAKKGFRLVRGSSSRGGKEALSSLKDALGAGHPVAITFDGPRGPRLVPKPGIAVCAWHAAGSLYLIEAEILRSIFFEKGMCLRLKSWDRFVVPLPFCRLRVSFVKLALPDKKENPLEEWVACALKTIQSTALAFYQREENVSVSKTSGS